MKELGRSLQCRGMNAGKLLCAGALLVGAGCVTDPGDLGAVSGSSGGDSESGASDSGEVSASGTGATSTTVDPTDASSSGGEETGTTGDPIEPECEVDIAAGLERVMTRDQFQNALEDLFAVRVDVDIRLSAYFDGVEAYSDSDLTGIDDAAASTAAAFEVPACAVEPSDCAAAFIDEYAPVVLRGQGDHDALMSVYEGEASHEEGIRAVVESMITDPAFSDLSPTGDMDGDFIVLDGVSLATRLSLLMWNTVPDAALLASADALLEEGGIAAALPPMFNDPRYSRAQADLYRILTEVDDLPGVDRSNVDASWSEETAAAMIEEQRRFVDGLAIDPAATISDLLTSSSTSVNGELAALYGDDLQTPAPGGASWGPAELDPSRRGGILTQLGFITRHSGNTPTDGYEVPTHRGLAVSESLGCLLLPPPPPDEPEPIGDVFDRESWEAEVEGMASCAGCHSQMDPHGHAYGHYDGLGRWHESGNAVAGTHPSTELEFADAVDLSAQLAEHEDVRACMATQHFRFAMRREETDADACTIAGITGAFNESGGNLRALVEAIATADAFRLARL